MTTYSLRCGLPLILLAGAALTHQAPLAKAQEIATGQATSTRLPVILAQPPLPGSEAYRIMRRVTGTAHSEPLEMTGGQVWFVEPSRLDMLLHVADEKRVAAAPVGAGSNHVLRNHGAGMGLTAGQKRMMGIMKADKAVTGIMIVKTARPSEMEFALAKYKDRLAKGDNSQPYGPPEIVIPISTDRQITVRRTYFDSTREGCVWFGTIAGTEEQVSLMWWPEGRISGSFTHAGRMYSIKSLGGRVHAVVEMDPARMPADHASAPAAMKTRMTGKDPLIAQGDASMLKPDRPHPPGNALDPLRDAAPMPGRDQAKLPEIVLARRAGETTPGSKVRVDVLVGFTRKAAQHYVDIRRELIALAVEQTNQTFRNSGIDTVELNLAGSFETDYDETNAYHVDHLWRMADRGDRYMEDVHGLRNAMHADVVVLIVDDPSGCGLSTRVGADAHEAFAVVHHGCATSTFSFAHEIGHIFGARHDRSIDQFKVPFPWGHGYANGVKWRTMMAYRESCNDCPRVPVWSNTVARIGGEHTGDDETNNARVIVEQARRVASFR